MKGQINLEFLSATFIYLIALGILLSVGSNALPNLSGSTQEASLHLEAKRITDKMLSSPGSQEFSGNSSWEMNETTINSVSSFGLASDYKEIEREKIEKISTIDPRSGEERLNYSVFKRLTEADNQYRFNFTWHPIVETPDSFTRCNPPDRIVEPVDCDGIQDTIYENSGNTVHWGSEEIDGDKYYFLLASHNGIYDTAYAIDNESRYDGDSDGTMEWNFSESSGPLNLSNSVDVIESETRIQSFQNFENEEGSMMVLERHLKTFGANPDSDSQVVNLERAAIMDGEPVRIKVLTW